MTDSETGKDFATPWFALKPHWNAITDLCFSADDHRLAAVSGDKVGKIIDLKTQTVTHCLDRGHAETPRHIVFQPGHEDIVATCGRDGRVQLWDLRCSTRRPLLYTAVDEAQGVLPDHFNGRSVTPFKGFIGGLGNSLDRSPVPTRRDKIASSRAAPSVTSLRFLPTQPHLFVTATDHSARLRVWDVRARYGSTLGHTPRHNTQHHLQAEPPRRQTLPVPVSTSSLPESTARGHGVNDMAISTDGARLYSICRDDTVHVYSTAHLVLGQSPSASQPPRQSRTGAAPLHRLAAPDLRIDSFYVRGAVRRATPERPELLAVGSSLRAPILFDTDERRFRREAPSFRDSMPGVPVYACGVPLVRGHTAEVVGVAWTHEGSLVSVGDDFHVKIWREDAAEAARLRGMSSNDPQTFGKGWAAHDEDDDDDGEE